MAKVPWRECWIVAGVAAASLTARAFLAARLGVFQDEALYWWLSRDDGMSFCPQPPAVALLVRWGEAVLGPGTLGVRAGSLLCGTAGVALAALLGWELYGRRAGLWAAALFAACPLLAAVGSASTPDAPIVCLWLLFMWATWRAAHTDSLAWWAASGVVLAVGCYTKYMMALAVPCAFLALCGSERGRRLLRRPGPWLSLGLGTVLFAPVFLAWNAQHEWAVVRYHLAARHVWTLEWPLLAQYVAAHLGAVSPGICIGVLASFAVLWREWRRTGRWRSVWLLSFGLVPILAFLAPSLFTRRRMLRVQWDLIGYAAGIIALAGIVAGEDRDGRTKRLGLGIGSLVGAVAITAALFASSVWPALATAVHMRPPALRMLGWRELAAKVRELEAGMQEPHFVLTSSFQSALCLGFERRSRHGVYTILTGDDRQYGLTDQLKAWGMAPHSFLEERPGQQAIYVHEFRHPEAPRPADYPRRVLEFFDQLEPLGEVEVVIGRRTLRRFGLYRAHQMRLSSQISVTRNRP